MPPLPPPPPLSAIATVVVSILLNDVAWALYVRRVSEGRAVKSGLWASMIYGSGIVLTIEALHNYWLIPIAVVTTFFGTSGTVFFDKRTKRRRNLTTPLP